MSTAPYTPVMGPPSPEVLLQTERDVSEFPFSTELSPQRLRWCTRASSAPLSITHDLLYITLSNLFIAHCTVSAGRDQGCRSFPSGRGLGSPGNWYTLPGTAARRIRWPSPFFGRPPTHEKPPTRQGACPHEQGCELGLKALRNEPGAGGSTGAARPRASAGTRNRVRSVRLSPRRAPEPRRRHAGRSGNAPTRLPGAVPPVHRRSRARSRRRCLRCPPGVGRRQPPRGCRSPPR